MNRAPRRIDRPKRSRLPRGRGWLLVALGAFLALDAPPAPTAAPDAPRAVQAGAPAAPAPDARIESALRKVNPALSGPEAARIGDAVVRYSTKYGLEPDLVTAVLLVESSGRPWAVSPAGAKGLMQVMPHMLRPMGLVGNFSTIETNIEAGCIILADNIRRLGESDGISAYFWGSEIRSDGYLERVRAARAGLRSFATSS
jgi:soluble lytic murein transglycosylase-like protein